eukprot:TRINITY_DN92935_c0_g1_i1.p1 TRINITY_DN92935_c0_g1~~TRINITY_DN92935_c0_g1_i1.p1  ORF type:complete len:562 (-),score=155.55 TRINITY_DN92935_c0_g1_i1:43-1728(-)
MAPMPRSQSTLSVDRQRQHRPSSQGGSRRRPSAILTGDSPAAPSKPSRHAWEEPPAKHPDPEAMDSEALGQQTAEAAWQGSVALTRFSRNRRLSPAAVANARAEEEVRGLGDDKPRTTSKQSAKEGSHEMLMARLKSRSARVEADNMKTFLLEYRMSKMIDRECEAKLDRLLRSTEKKAEELRKNSEKLRSDVTEAEFALEKFNKAWKARQENSLSSSLKPGMSSFERSQLLIQENKLEEELAQQRDEAKNHFDKQHRKLQSELVELRDYKVLLGEYRRSRLEKLQDNLGRVTDGRKLRAIVREMIRQGGQRVLHRLEATATPLEPWMCQVLVNCCHLELRVEEAEKRLLPLQKSALRPLMGQVGKMANMPKERRFDRLCTWTWDSLKDEHLSDQGSGAIMEANPWRKPPKLDCGHRVVPQSQSVTQPKGLKRLVKIPSDKPAPSGVAARLAFEVPHLAEEAEAASSEDDEPPSHPKFASQEPDVVAAEHELVSLRHLLEDTRQNAAAAICNRVRQAAKGCSGGAKEAMAWGYQMLTLMVNEDFAKAATKELRRTHSMLTL